MSARHALTSIALGLAWGLLSSTFGCQATALPGATPANAASPAPSPHERVPLLTGDPTLDATEAVGQGDTVHLVPAAAGEGWSVPITYARGVEETVEWVGTGVGTATLLNAYGQQVYRISEGGERFTGIVPAGQYRLVISHVAPPAGVSLLLEVSATGASQQARLIRRSDEEGPVTRAMDRRVRIPCPAIADEVAVLDLRIKDTSDEMARLARLRGMIKPLVVFVGDTRVTNAQWKDFKDHLAYFKLKDGQVPAYYYGEIDRMNQLAASRYFEAQRERRSLIDKHCP